MDRSESIGGFTETFEQIGLVKIRHILRKPTKNTNEQKWKLNANAKRRAQTFTAKRNDCVSFDDWSYGDTSFHGIIGLYIDWIIWLKVLIVPVGFPASRFIGSSSEIMVRSVDSSIVFVRWINEHVSYFMQIQKQNVEIEWWNDERLNCR